MFHSSKRIVVKASPDDPRKKQLRTSTANFGFPALNTGLSGFTGGGGMNVSASGSGLLNNLDTMMVGLIPEDEQSLLRMYRDIYSYDVVAGSAVDLMSTLPFSDFSLLGADEDKLEHYYKSIEAINCKSLLPDMSVEYLVTGKFSGTLLFDENTKSFSDVITHAPENLTTIPAPLYGADPMLVARVTQEMRQFLSSNDPYFARLRKRIPDSMVKAMQESPHVVLDPVMTVYLPRRTSARSTGVSIYKRILPIYLLEKVLYRGTITEANKRQRATGHLKAGSEYWEPQDADLQMLLALFQQADLDPLGAIVATRHDVDYSEIRAGGDFWKWTDILDITTGLKLKALGVSDAFLSGEANWNTADAALSVFLEQLRAYRDMVTAKFFYDKLFPVIATMNELHIDGKVNERVMSALQTYGAQDGSNMMSQLPMQEGMDPNMVSQGVSSRNTENLRRSGQAYKALRGRRFRNKEGLLIPEIHWHKQLRPEADREYLDVLNTLSEHGVPVTLRAWAAAGGMSMEHLMDELEEDVQLRQQIAKLVKQGTGGEGGEEDDGYGGGEDFAEAKVTAGRVLAAMSGKGRKSLLSRDFGEHSEAHTYSKTGKKKSVHNPQHHARRQNEAIARSLRRLADVEHAESVRKDTKRKSRR